MKENNVYKVYYAIDDEVGYGIKEVCATNWEEARRKFFAECPSLEFVMMEHDHLFKH
nr:MAG TPA: hypothetical protein [Caudoviricetes sp.]